MTTATDAKTLASDLRALIAANMPVWVWGKRGIGKSEIVGQAAADIRSEEIAALGPLSVEALSEIALIPTLIDIRLSMFDPVDLRGLAAIIDGLTKWLRPAIWPVENRFGLTVILFFDEMDRAATAVANAALQIVLDRRIGEHPLPATVRIVAAGNGSTDGRTTNKIGTAQADRFAHLYLAADARAAADHWARIGLDPALSAFIRYRPELIDKDAIAPELAGASPRSWAACNALMPLSDAQRHRLIAAKVGSAHAGEFEAFLRMWRDLPPLATILRNPTGAPVSSELGVNFAIAGALARAADQGNFAAIATYGQRMPVEFEVCMIGDSVRRNPGLATHPAYTQFCIRHQGFSL